MTIRSRTVNVAAGRATALALLGAAALHAAWAAGSTWPRSTSDGLADLVVGRRPFPSPAACAAVAGLLVGGAAVTGTVVGDLPALERASPVDPRWPVRALAVVMALRGVAGLVTSGLGLGSPAEEYRRHDLTLYSPLCLALGAGALLASRSAVGADR